MSTHPAPSALVTGATGFIGGHLVDALLAQGWRVRALVRNAKKATALPAAVERFQGDIAEAGTLKGVADGMQVVFHCAAQLNLPGVSREEYQRGNVLGTTNLLEAVRPAGIQKFVQVSSIAAIGIRDVGLIDESYPPNPDLDYGISKLEVDKLLLAAHREWGLPVVILRPPTVYGPGERYNFLLLCKAIASKKFLIIGKGENRIDFCWVGNLVNAMIAAAERGRPGEVYNIADAPPLSFAQAAQTIADELGGNPFLRFHLPKPAALLAAALMEKVEARTGKAMPLNLKRVRTMTGDMCFDLGKARRELGYKPELNFADKVHETVRWYRQEGLL